MYKYTIQLGFFQLSAKILHRFSSRLLLDLVFIVKNTKFLKTAPTQHQTHRRIVARHKCFAALLQQYFSANEQCFPLTTNQHKHQYKPNFSETNRTTHGHKAHCL
jgi:hypothetical protein